MQRLAFSVQVEFSAYSSILNKLSDGVVHCLTLHQSTLNLVN
ncbi:hypothetical protein VCR4J5_1480005 [Vibrio crassostreae]|uniref:Uncharacterized protein n=1 Tax=Vibrio crassostreae TaxID=246167 RepID=A0ABM9QNW5_9VIBR|nr:hypothetical protein VCRA2119O46_10261 [Vibrio crassostreae]CAK1872822.1 hypothetical protein VCRA2116O31_10277 [Vibrio crassostreae]CAK1889281.1 hypothetical protein VCRA2116O28_10542 [Vibrio crassostreae]CAK1890725.1 hypothetical protein VCRA2116O27_10541 [Vibrio crassostreae]CAK1891443.1 hypothetical protein VCRA2117O38_10541 [Vibrio crassostreae]